MWKICSFFLYFVYQSNFLFIDFRCKNLNFKLIKYSWEVKIRPNLFIVIAWKDQNMFVLYIDLFKCNSIDNIICCYRTLYYLKWFWVSTICVPSWKQVFGKILNSKKKNCVWMKYWKIWTHRQIENKTKHTEFSFQPHTWTKTSWT